jgi:hypothetical protein
MIGRGLKPFDGLKPNKFEKYSPNFLFKGKNENSEGVGGRVMGGEDSFSIWDDNVHPLLL